VVVETTEPADPHATYKAYGLDHNGMDLVKIIAMGLK
jgi:hypothetical protein